MTTRRYRSEVRELALRHPRKTIAFLAAVVSALSPGLALAYTVCGADLTLTPMCGETGKHVSVSGKGWAFGDCASASTQPGIGSVSLNGRNSTTGSFACEYRYYFSGEEKLVADYPQDAEPKYSFPPVPPAGPGLKPVRVELWTVRDFPIKKVQCREIDFWQVDHEEHDPWRNGGDGSAVAGNLGRQFTFNPEGVCSIPECDQIVFIQAVRPIVEFADGAASRVLTPTEVDTPNSAYLEARVTQVGESADPGWVIDTQQWINPYYEDSYGGEYGRQLPGDAHFAQIYDHPWADRNTIAGDAKDIIWNMQSGVRCVKGPAAGTWLGVVEWSYVQGFDGNGRGKDVVPNYKPVKKRDSPYGGQSGGLEGALTKWKSKSSWHDAAPSLCRHEVKKCDN